LSNSLKSLADTGEKNLGIEKSTRNRDRKKNQGEFIETTETYAIHNAICI
jgi:hypothetical protein